VKGERSTGGGRKERRRKVRSDVIQCRGDLSAYNTMYSVY